MIVKDPIQQAGMSLMTLPKEITPDDMSSELEGGYCIKTEEFLCSCRDRPWRYMHYEGKIIVWNEKDDESILYSAKELKKMDLSPRIVVYTVMMGKGIPWDDIPSGATLG